MPYDQMLGPPDTFVEFLQGVLAPAKIIYLGILEQ